jgi:hypothetical protein
MIPEVVTHNYDPEGIFLANLCDLPQAEAEQTVQRIRDTGKRIIKANYLGKRLETEAWLISERQRLRGERAAKGRSISSSAISPTARIHRGRPRS